MSDEDTDTLYVEANEGRVVDLLGANAPKGGGSVRLKFGDPPIRIPNTSDNRRRLRDGHNGADSDLRLVDEAKLPGPATAAVLRPEPEDLLDTPTKK